MANTGKIIGKSFKALFYLVIILINAIILWRVLFSGDPASIKPLAANEVTAHAYSEFGKDLVLQTQNQRTISGSGKFSVTDCVFIPQANQVQITIRYNNSTLSRLKEDFDLESEPDRENEVFDVTIVKTTDLTPESKDDNTDPAKLREERFYPSEIAGSAYKPLYSYRKYIFDNISYDDAVGMFVDIYYKGDMDYSSSPYDALCIYDELMPLEERKLSGKDIKSISSIE